MPKSADWRSRLHNDGSDHPFGFVKHAEIAINARDIEGMRVALPEPQRAGIEGMRVARKTRVFGEAGGSGIASHRMSGERDILPEDSLP